MDFEEFKEIICIYRSYSEEDLNLIKKAFELGEKAFENIKRLSGEPYFNHCIRVALILAELGLDSKTICAGLLHDILEDTDIAEKEIENLLGQEILFLIKGVTKIEVVKYKEKNLEQARNLLKFILAISKDLRIAILKLADRLDNMRTLEYLPRERQINFALETQDIFVPLALRLGIYEWAGELDDLAFKFLEPEKYKEVIKMIEEKIKDGEKILIEIKSKLEEILKSKNINLIDIQFRIKRPSSVYKKLKRKDFDINQIYDLLAMRVIVSTVEECYITLGVIHSLYKPLLEEFNDYIANPKPNGYKSLHTTCYIGDGKYVEFQIRTYEMHKRNEEGIAATFAYAETKQTKNYQKKKAIFASKEDLSLIQEIRKWKMEKNQEDIIDVFKTDILKERIYVFTPKGEVIELPIGSTPLDFAYKIHTEIGNHYSGARVNGKMVPIDYELKTGDIVEIVTNKNKKPSLDWLQIVKTNYAKKKIRSSLKKLNPYLFQKTYIIYIKAKDRIGLLKDIANIISSKGFNITSSKSKVKNGIAKLYFEIKMNSKEEFNDLKDEIRKKIEGVIDIV